MNVFNGMLVRDGKILCMVWLRISAFENCIPEYDGFKLQYKLDDVIK